MSFFSIHIDKDKCQHVITSDIPLEINDLISAFNDVLCYRCNKQKPNTYSDGEWIHDECPMVCQNNHKINTHIPAYKYTDDDLEFNHVYHCNEGCSVTHLDIYRNISASDYYNHE